MLTGSNLRYNTAIDTVQIHLRSNTICEDFSTILYKRHRSLITR